MLTPEADPRLRERQMSPIATGHPASGYSSWHAWLVYAPAEMYCVLPMMMMVGLSLVDCSRWYGDSVHFGPTMWRAQYFLQRDEQGKHEAGTAIGAWEVKKTGAAAKGDEGSRRETVRGHCLELRRASLRLSASHG